MASLVASALAHGIYQRLGQTRLKEIEEDFSRYKERYSLNRSNKKQRTESQFGVVELRKSLSLHDEQKKMYISPFVDKLGTSVPVPMRLQRSLLENAGIKIPVNNEVDTPGEPQLALENENGISGSVLSYRGFVESISQFKSFDDLKDNIRTTDREMWARYFSTEPSLHTDVTDKDTLTVLSKKDDYFPLYEVNQQFLSLNTDLLLTFKDEVSEDEVPDVNYYPSYKLLVSIFPVPDDFTVNIEDYDLLNPESKISKAIKEIVNREDKDPLIRYIYDNAIHKFRKNKEIYLTRLILIFSLLGFSNVFLKFLSCESLLGPITRTTSLAHKSLTRTPTVGSKRKRGGESTKKHKRKTTRKIKKRKTLRRRRHVRI